MDDKQEEKTSSVKWASLLKITDFKEHIEVASKLSLALVAVCYVAGLLIINIHLRQYGVFQLTFLQIDYVMAGALWIFLCSALYFFSFQVMNLKFFNDLKWHTSKEKLRAVLSLLAGLFLTLGGSGYLVVTLSGNTLLLFHWRTYVLILVVGFNVFALLGMADAIRQVINEWSTGFSDELYKRAKTYEIFYMTILVLTSLSSYALIVYPRLSPAFGGGLRQKAEFIIKKDQLDSVKNLGITLDEGNGRTTALEVIFESPDFFIVSPPTGFDTRDQVESIRLRRDVVDAAYYLKIR